MLNVLYFHLLNTWQMILKNLPLTWSGTQKKSIEEKEV